MANGSSIPPHYRMLGIEPGASEEEIKQAYRRMAKRFHPDANPDDPSTEELFKKVADAYRILSDPSSRRRYDRAAGVATSKTSEPEPPPPEKPVSRDILVRLHLTLEQAASGGSRELKIPRKTPCTDCRGSGQLSGARCKKCNGVGVIKKLTSVDIIHPAGVRAGSRLSYSGWGHRLPPDNRSGDLIVEISFKPHKYFDVHGADLHYRALIRLDLFIEGGTLRIPTLSGPLDLAIPARVPDGRTIKVPGRGLPGANGEPAGDLKVVLQTCLPKKLSRKERQKIDELMTLPGFHPHSDSDGFIPKGD